MRAVEAAGAEWIHVDVMDGHFVPTITMGPLIAEAVRGVAKGVMDVHLMVEDPERFVGDFVRCGADMITVHVEASRHLHRALRSIRECGARAGVALNPSTPVTAVEEVLEEMDMVVVMSVNPGFGGQEFIPRSVDKVARVREMIDSCRPGGIEIEVDGGVDVSTAPALVEAGATVLVAGSAVFRHEGGSKCRV